MFGAALRALPAETLRPERRSAPRARFEQAIEQYRTFGWFDGGTKTLPQNAHLTVRRSASRLAAQSFWYARNASSDTGTPRFWRFMPIDPQCDEQYCFCGRLGFGMNSFPQTGHVRGLSPQTGRVGVLRVGCLRAFLLAYELRRLMMLRHLGEQ